MALQDLPRQTLFLSQNKLNTPLPRIFLYFDNFISYLFCHMTVSKTKKSETLAELKADLTRAKSFALVQSNRITVAEVSKVRR